MAITQAIYDEALHLGCVPNKWVLTALLQAQASGADVTAAAAAVTAMDAARATGVTLELDTECVYALIQVSGFLFHEAAIVNTQLLYYTASAMARALAGAERIAV